MLQNLHTHTNLCDGKNSPEEIVEKAILQGFDSIGFSAHGKTRYNTDWELQCSAEEYITKINSLKKSYSDKIKIFLGSELDYYSKGVMPTEALDYTIGSVHSTEINGKTVDFDLSYENSKENVDTFFGSNAIEYVRAYYENVVKASREIEYDIVGHFDLITKFSEAYPSLIDTESSAYRNIALEALCEVRKNKELFEVNTGAIAKGLRTVAYPAPFLLDGMRRLGCKLILTSDCHDKNLLDAGFNDAKLYIKAHGFDTLYYLSDEGFVGEKI